MSARLEIGWKEDRVGHLPYGEGRSRVLMLLSRLLTFDYTQKISIKTTVTQIIYIMADPKFLKYVDDHEKDFIDRLAKAVAIPS